MKIHDYQAKEILRRFDVPTPRGIPCFSVDEAVAAAEKLGGSVWVVKAQIHAGGRGKGHFKEKEAGEKGGVRLAKSVSEAEELTRQMLGRTLVTHQTGATGKQVNRIYIEDGSDIERELYLALLVDRGNRRVSARGAVFVIRAGGVLMVKRVARHGQALIVTSDNPDHPRVDDADVELIGRVVWLSRALE
jgi:succinyl-CoA synthetase beta subunit